MSTPVFVAQTSAPAAPQATPATPVESGPVAGTAGKSLSGATTTGSVEPPAYAKPGGPMSYFPFLLLGLMFVMIMLRGGKGKDQKKMRAMLDNLKKGDRVQTIGGVLGTVVELREKNEVVVKVDENNNTKVRFARNAIHRVIEDSDGTPTTTTTK